MAEEAPAYLSGYGNCYRENPRRAAQEWFKNAKFGLFVHWGLYSKYGESCPYLYNNDDVSIPEYKGTMEEFDAPAFDADAITDLAVDAEMKYVTFVSRHHDSFSLWDTDHSDFKSTNAPAGRDFVRELAKQCREKELGLFLYYSYGLDWTHPSFPTEASGIVRASERVDGHHRWEPGDDNDEYVEFMHDQIRELLTDYGPIAGIWLDPISSYYQRPDLFPIRETYGLIRSLQPQCLVSFKNGATGTEDFITPEQRLQGGALDYLDRGQMPELQRKAIRQNWNMQLDGIKEFCATLEEEWGYVEDTERMSPEDVLDLLGYANATDSNLLLNTAPTFEGNVHPASERIIRQVGEQLRSDGWPTEQRILE
ncbi:alpha-L-fucosidase [Salinarchaeum laminariae]|uniref:alpha-L-fucosidase n=1 Tax=Salinarchaeum laminariae TaxID=869888 RepID=UPI0020BEBFC1|nr:alpha-L-fucosidase [Salinarchaeum laminariae]